MIEWLNQHADGFALLFWACVAGGVFVVAAALVEFCLARAMRRRERRRQALVRYCSSIGGRP